MPYVSNFISEMPLFSLIFLEKCTSGAMGPDRSADSGKTSYYDKKIHCPLLPIAVGELIRLCGAADDCGFNRSMQHLISNYREEDVENEAASEDLLQRN